MNRIELLNQLLQLTVWLPIEDYPNYEISICGQVRNIKTKRVLKQCINRNGYYYVKLNRNNEKFKHQRIHRVVAKTFIPNLNNENFVDHIDSNRLNNTVSNLRWVSSQQNNFNR